MLMENYGARCAPSILGERITRIDVGAGLKPASIAGI
jgi:hypothetical protein